MRYAIGILTILLLFCGIGLCLTYIVSRIVKFVDIKKRLKKIDEIYGQPKGGSEKLPLICPTLAQRYTERAPLLWVNFPLRDEKKENNEKMNCQNCKFYTYDEDEDGNALESCDRFGCYLNEIAGLKPDEGCIEYERRYFPRREL